jgi:hypothetical protein
MKSIIFWDMTPCSPLSFTRRFGGTYLLATCLLDGLLNYSSTLKMEAIRSSETSRATQRTTRRHIPEDDDTLHNHRCENSNPTRNFISELLFYNYLTEIGIQFSIDLRRIIHAEVL